MSDLIDLELALAFAKLELIELQAKRRTLGQCPGIKQVAEHIARHEAAVAAANRKDKCGLPASGHRDGTCNLRPGHDGDCWFPNMWNDM